MERGGLIKKTSLMQLFFKDKIYTLNSNRYWFSVHFQVLYESLFNRITSSLQDLQSLRARLSYCTYDTFCLADFHLTTRLLHLPHLRTFRLPNLSFPSKNLFPIYPLVSFRPDNRSLDISFDFRKNSISRKHGGLIKLNCGETVVQTFFNAFRARSKSRISAVATRNHEDPKSTIPIYSGEDRCLRLGPGVNVSPIFVNKALLFRRYKCLLTLPPAYLPFPFRSNLKINAPRGKS